jgi:hypothetical protein
MHPPWQSFGPREQSIDYLSDKSEARAEGNMSMQSSTPPQLAAHEIQEQVLQRLEKYKKLNVLEQFAMFMGKESMEIERFYFEWNGNGCLEVWTDGKCLGRCDAFIPTNVFLDFDAYEKGVEEMKAEAARRPRRQNLQSHRS